MLLCGAHLPRLLPPLWKALNRAEDVKKGRCLLQVTFYEEAARTCCALKGDTFSKHQDGSLGVTAEGGDWPVYRRWRDFKSTAVYRNVELRWYGVGNVQAVPEGPG